ncbi:DUF4044 domain-containing protein [Vagococcus lutrae]|uniref:DUF4044 domain-containing protein n=2 Tax=Vagococcus lutrae TaxID=81947 RepID=V6Q4T1_9ENTE|nr:MULTISPECIES: DUF4044 domain-containing protein [Vagococcus]EST90129.1 hypothetical protein T233_00695 [Vagococcus lutrae LBD1]MCO7151222.1 DUF4044 domain-containing protein [Vagococcus lutrae]MDO5742003.1 DUF4044 domain-containing protein [Vagococcus sp.]MDT2801378.1 DUF4044 domain-containing protein [Vagococcus lutrae]MDT2805796.1 DUF4044 domain-containing protein [Vagococcus lutrae]
MNSKKFNTIKKIVIWIMLIAIVGSAVLAAVASIL